jgi:hypothetical protein
VSPVAVGPLPVSLAPVLLVVPVLAPGSSVHPAGRTARHAASRAAAAGGPEKIEVAWFVIMARGIAGLRAPVGDTTRPNRDTTRHCGGDTGLCAQELGDPRIAARSRDTVADPREPVPRGDGASRASTPSAAPAAAGQHGRRRLRHIAAHGLCVADLQA